MGEALSVGFCRSWDASTCMGHVMGVTVWSDGSGVGHQIFKRAWICRRRMNLSPI